MTTMSGYWDDVDDYLKAVEEAEDAWNAIKESEWKEKC